MIVVFVVDTSPTMGLTMGQTTCANRSEKASTALTRLDIAKMTAETITKAMNRRIQSHNSYVTSFQEQQPCSSLESIGFGSRATLDYFLLISTGYQGNHGNRSSSGVTDVRILVDYGGLTDLNTSFEVDVSNNTPSHYQTYCASVTQNHLKFEKELKNLSLPKISEGLRRMEKVSNDTFPENGGGVQGLNAALSAGLQLMSRYRLHNRWTENFGLGRLPSTAIVTHGALGLYGSSCSSAGFTSSTHQASQALQPACLILLTDGECLNQRPELGGGALELQYGSIPLREFYKEPFRWDQRIICLRINSSLDDLHPSLKALCDVTGGYHGDIRSVSCVDAVVESLLRSLAPALPHIPFPNPLQAPRQPKADHLIKKITGGLFVNGGPICIFQSMSSENRSLYRAMLLFVPTSLDNGKNNTIATTMSTPMWCIPESFFPSSKYDSLPPRNAQPTLIYFDTNVIDFNASEFMKALNRLDEYHANNARFLHRDVYICEWLSSNGDDIKVPISSSRQEFFPVFVRGAGRSTTIDGTDNLLSVGILHVPRFSLTLAEQSSLIDQTRLSTLTLFPPDSHILLPLLLRAADIEHRSLQITMKRNEETRKITEPSVTRVSAGSVAKLIRKISDSSNSSTKDQGIVLDDTWKNELKAYIHRIPPYCLVSVKRCLKPILPSGVHYLLGTDTIEALTAQCFSRLCHQKIRMGEAAAKDAVDRADQGYDESTLNSLSCDESKVLVYGQYDRKIRLSSYLATLRAMSPPWKRSHCVPESLTTQLTVAEQTRVLSTEILATTCLGDLPTHGLLAYYDSRRRWVFGGCGQTVRGLFVEGVKKDSDSNLFLHDRATNGESLLSLSSVGAADTGQIKSANMGDFRERLLSSPQPFIGYANNDANKSAIASGPDGAPIWSVDDDALPFYFFDPMTGEFIDTANSRTRSRLSINFGNPFKFQRGDAICPKNYEHMSPGMKRFNIKNDKIQSQPNIDITSDAFIDGEGEADSMKLSISSPSKRSRSLSDGIKKDSSPCDIIQVPDKYLDNANTKQEQHDSNVRNMATPPRMKPSTPTIRPKLQYLVTNDRSKPPPPPTEPHPNHLQQHSGKSIAQSAETESHLMLEVSPPNMQDPNNKPDIKLPPDWMLVWSKSKKRWYYFDKRTQESVWEWPTATHERG